MCFLRYANLKEHLETKVCEKYLTNLDPEYLSILHPEENMEEIMFIEANFSILYKARHFLRS